MSAGSACTAAATDPVASSAASVLPGSAFTGTTAHAKQSTRMTFKRYAQTHRAAARYPQGPDRTSASSASRGILPAMTWEDLLSDWVLWMRSADRSPRTITERAALIRRLAHHTDPADCNWRPLAGFLADPAFGRSTKQQYRAILRQWFAFLALVGHRPDNPVDRLPRVTTPPRRPRPVTVAQVATILASSRYYGKTRTKLLLAHYQGLRAMEIAKIRGEDFTSGRLRVIGKGGRERWLPIHPLVEAERGRYPDIGYWFPRAGDPSRPVTAKSVSRALADAMRRSGVNAVGHQARHFYGTQTLAASGGNLRHAQELLGHASVATTQIYTAVNDADLAATVNALPVPLYAVANRSRIASQPPHS